MLMRYRLGGIYSSFVNSKIPYLKQMRFDISLRVVALLLPALIVSAAYVISSYHSPILIDLICTQTSRNNDPKRASPYTGPRIEQNLPWDLDTPPARKSEAKLRER